MMGPYGGAAAGLLFRGSNTDQYSPMVALFGVGESGAGSGFYAMTWRTTEGGQQGGTNGAGGFQGYNTAITPPSYYLRVPRPL